MTPDKQDPHGDVKHAIEARWGSVDKCLTEFVFQAKENFGSGWTWLVKNGNDVAILNTSNAVNPMTNGFQPILTVDIWEHAYYIDYLNARDKYLNNWKELINWKFVDNNFKADKVSVVQ